MVANLAALKQSLIFELSWQFLSPVKIH
jgi:hypothetical protein